MRLIKDTIKECYEGAGRIAAGACRLQRCDADAINGGGCSGPAACRHPAQPREHGNHIHAGKGAA